MGSAVMTKTQPRKPRPKAASKKPRAAGDPHSIVDSVRRDKPWSSEITLKIVEGMSFSRKNLENTIEVAEQILPPDDVDPNTVLQQVLTKAAYTNEMAPLVKSEPNGSDDEGLSFSESKYKNIYLFMAELFSDSPPDISQLSPEDQSILITLLHQTLASAHSSKNDKARTYIICKLNSYWLSLQEGEEIRWETKPTKTGRRAVSGPRVLNVFGVGSSVRNLVEKGSRLDRATEDLRRDMEEEMNVGRVRERKRRKVVPVDDGFEDF